jgi:hypothetical protein
MQSPDSCGEALALRMISLFADFSSPIRHLVILWP